MEAKTNETRLSLDGTTEATKSSGLTAENHSEIARSVYTPIGYP